MCVNNCVEQKLCLLIFLAHSSEKMTNESYTTYTSSLDGSSCAAFLTNGPIDGKTQRSGSDLYIEIYSEKRLASHKKVFCSMDL